MARHNTTDEVYLAPMPEWLQGLLTEPEPKRSNGANGSGAIPEGQRNSHLASLAGSMRRGGISVQAIEVAVLIENMQRCNPPLPEDEVRQIACSIGRYQLDKNVRADKHEHTKPNGKT